MKSLRVLAVAMAVAAQVPIGAAQAGTVGSGTPSFTLDVTSSVGQDHLQLTPTLTADGKGGFTTSGNDSATSFSILYDLNLNPDPHLSGSFTLTNLSGTTQTFTVTATLGVTPLAGPTTISGSYGGTEGATFTDANGSESVVVTTALLFQARIDDTGVADLGSFPYASASGGAGVSGTLAPLSFDPKAGPGVASTIGVALPGFTLTAGDSLEVPFEFLVVPEPDFACLFAGMAAIFLARAARRVRG